MKKSIRIAATAAFIAIAAVLFVLGMILLPDTVVVQINASGEASNAMPKLLGILLPLILAVGGALWFYSASNPANEKATAAKNPVTSSLLISVVGLAAMVFMLIVNL